MISFNVRGSTRNTERFLTSVSKLDVVSLIDPIAQEGVRALAAATPKETGRAALSWGYRIDKTRRGFTVTWFNTDNENNFHVAAMLQYGYGTGTGGYVPGRDYINPAMKPIFDQIADKMWKAVSSA